jgi:phosphatidylserine decarboxylase
MKSLGSWRKLQSDLKFRFLNSEKFGQVLFVPVGAMLVGKIVETYQPDKFYKKSDEIGYFAFGGSSIVMIFKKGSILPIENFIQNSLHDHETRVSMGQCIANKS